MNCRILEAQDLAGLLLVRNKADLSAAFLLPHLLHLALSANLRVCKALLSTCSCVAFSNSNVTFFAPGGAFVGPRLDFALPVSFAKTGVLAC